MGTRALGWLAGFSARFAVAAFSALTTLRAVSGLSAQSAWSAQSAGAGLTTVRAISALSALTTRSTLTARSARLAGSAATIGCHHGVDELLEGIQQPLLAGIIVVAFIVAVWPRRRTIRRLAAFSSALIIGFELTTNYWFYPYVSWFEPFVFLALLPATNPKSPLDAEGVQPAPEDK